MYLLAVVLCGPARRSHLILTSVIGMMYEFWGKKLSAPQSSITVSFKGASESSSHAELSTCVVQNASSFPPNADSHLGQEFSKERLVVLPPRAAQGPQSDLTSTGTSGACRTARARASTLPQGAPCARRVFRQL